MKTIYTCPTCGTVHGVDEHLGPEFALCGKCLRAKIQALMEAAKSTEDAYKRRIDRLEREVEDLEGQVSDLEARRLGRETTPGNLPTADVQARPGERNPNGKRH